MSHITATAHIIHVLLGFTSTRLGALKCLAQGHSHEKTQRVQCGSNPEPLEYVSNTLPLSHVGPSSIENQVLTTYTNLSRFCFLLSGNYTFFFRFRVPRGSGVRCLTRNPGVLGSSRTRSSGFFSLECPWARHFRAPSLVLVKPRKA